jgi:hypothetical protein
MSFAGFGTDALGGAGEGAAQGAMLTAGLKAAGFANPYAIPLIGGMAALGVSEKIFAGFADKPAERMNARLGSQQIEMNSLAIEETKRKARTEREQKAKMQAFNGIMSKIFAGYKGGFGAPGGV